jgi:primosomal protein N' (replication factor Y)
MGNGTRVGVVVSAGESAKHDGYAGELRNISEIIDEAPILGGYVLPLLDWFRCAYLCGMGTAMKTLLPDAFLRGEPLDAPAVFAEDSSADRRSPAEDVSFIYDPVDEERFEQYSRILSDGKPSLVSLPLYPAAKQFYEYLMDSPNIPRELKSRIFLFPRSGAKPEWIAWKKLISTDGVSIVIGGQSSAMAPLRGLSRVVIEDESNNVWRTVRPPIYNVRSLLSYRARLEGASLLMGGRMPSPRAYMRVGSGVAQTRGASPRSKKIFFVDLRMAYSPSIKGVLDSLAVSETLARETDIALSRGEWAIWILDRKGYAGEIICQECGAPVKCSRCGGTMRWESSNARVSCVSCGAYAPLPEECPNCAGRLLSARRPGLEALLPLARAAVNSRAPILPREPDDEITLAAVKKSQYGLIIGTRAAIALCDSVKVGLIGWIDADGEARSGEHDARVRAYSLIWESCWRGVSPTDRRVIIQTRRPGQDWQRGLDHGLQGWRTFWRDELKERRELSMPPFNSLVKIESGGALIRSMIEKLEASGYECWSPDEPDAKNGTLWIRTKRLYDLRRVLEPYFHITRARRGFPSVIVWHE